MLKECYIPVSPLLISRGEAFSFRLFIKNKTSETYILFAASEKFTDKHKTVLFENGVEELYIDSSDYKHFEQYVYDNYGRVLSDDNIPLYERSKIFYEHSRSLSREVFDCKLPENSLPEELVGKIEVTLTSNYEFLVSNRNAFTNVSRLIDHNYKTYSHCLNVSIYTLVILTRLGGFEDIMTDVGVGAFLHDIGKLRIPNAILDKPAKLTESEFQTITTHSYLGYMIARDSGMPDLICQCIHKHHEKLDGSGYPQGMGAEDIPRHIQAITIADIYDALSAERPYCRAYTPFEALKIMAKDAERHRISPDLFKGFVDILSGSGLTQ